MRPVKLAHFIDVNIPIYAVGRAHPYREFAWRILDLANERPREFVTDSEALQEIIHYYIAGRRWIEGRATLEQFAETMQGRIEPVYSEDVLLAAEMVDRYSGIDSRDLVHTAVMRRLGITSIISADTGFDRIDGIQRLDPLDLDQWENSMLDDE